MEANVKNISELIKCSGLTDNNFSYKSGYSENSIYNWKYGKCVINLVAAKDILHILGYELVIKKVNEDE